MLLYDVLVKSWGGALNEAVTLVSIIISIIRFGWKALDGDPDRSLNEPKERFYGSH